MRIAAVALFLAGFFAALAVADPSAPNIIAAVSFAVTALAARSARKDSNR
jgi:hypothetical protein